MNRIELIDGYYAVNKMKVKIVDAEHPDRAPRDCQEPSLEGRRETK